VEDARSTGLDAKSYPSRPLPRRERYDVIMFTHELCHELGYSQRAAQLELAACGYRRSTGTICNDLSRSMPGCPGCGPGQPG
jgi:hypothetical protein